MVNQPIVKNPYAKHLTKKRPRPAEPPKSTVDDSFDDGSIDWEEAFRAADAATLPKHPNIPSSSNDNLTRNASQSVVSSNIGRINASEINATAVQVQPKCYPLTDTKTKVVANNSCSLTHEVASRLQAGNTAPQFQSLNSSAPSIMKPPLAPGATRLNANSAEASTQHTTKSSVSETLSSLRPETWKQSKSSPLIQQTLAPTTTDTRQLSLPLPLRFDAEKIAEPIQDEYRTKLVKFAKLSEPLENGWTLFSHQKRAILAGILMRRMILALDMGLGKTLIGCCWARAFVKSVDNLKVVVICPVSMKTDWKRTAEEATGLTVEDFNSSSQTIESTATDVLIVSWAKIPTRIDSRHYVVIADEAHSMQNMNSARTRDALALMKSAMGVLLLTGTPMKNGKPLNLFPLLKAIDHPLGSHQRAYEAHFCGGREMQFGSGRTVWQANGAENLEQLRNLTKSHLLHLTKEDCLKNLPPQTRVTQHVPVSSRSQIQHNQALQKLAKVYENRHENNNQEAILGAVQNLRLVDSLAKVDATVKVATTVLQEEPAVVIFTSFVQVAKLVHQKLGDAGWHGEMLTGETPAKKRQAMVDNFQSGLSPVFVCTFGAGGVGLTLTAASTIILLDRPWTPGDAHQSEARVRRIGQTKPVKSIWMTAFELDKQIDSLIESKARTAVAVLSTKERKSGVDEDSTESSGLANGEAKLSIFKLLQSVLPPAKDGANHKGNNLTQTSILQYSQGSPSVKNS